MVSPRIFLVFKKIFGVEENKDLLISLVNSVVSEEDQIDTVQILNPYNAQDFKHDKLSVLCPLHFKIARRRNKIAS